MSRSAEYIVECAVCQQPWAVPRPLTSLPPSQYIVVPDHAMIGRSDSKSISGLPCPGRQTPGFGMGTRRDWEQRWGLRYPGRMLPSVEDGSRVQILTT
jgi:hypothetical protein